MGRMRLHEMILQLAHVDVIVDDHVAAHVMLGEPGRDLLSSAGAGRAGRGLVDNATGEALRFQSIIPEVASTSEPKLGHDSSAASGETPRPTTWRFGPG